MSDETDLRAENCFMSSRVVSVDKDAVGTADASTLVPLCAAAI